MRHRSCFSRSHSSNACSASSDANGTHLIRMAGSGSGLRSTGKAISGITGGPKAERLFGLRVRVSLSPINVFMSSADRASIACRLKWVRLLQPRIRLDVSLASLRPRRKVGGAPTLS